MSWEGLVAVLALGLSIINLVLVWRYNTTELSVEANWVREPEAPEDGLVITVRNQRHFLTQLEAVGLVHADGTLMRLPNELLSGPDMPLDIGSFHYVRFFIPAYEVEPILHQIGYPREGDIQVFAGDGSGRKCYAGLHIGSATAQDASNTLAPG